MGVPLQVEAAELIALGAVGADAARLHHGKAPDKIVVIGLGVNVSGHIGVGHLVIPDRWVGDRRRLKGGHAPGGGALFTGLIEPVVIKGGGIEKLRGIHAVLLHGARAVGGRVVDRAGLIHALGRSAGNLNQRLHQIGLAVAVGVMISLDIHAEAEDVAVLICVVFVSQIAVLQDGLGRAVLEYRRFRGFVREGRSAQGQHHGHRQQDA